jgi:hypothetical protein
MERRSICSIHVDALPDPCQSVTFGFDPRKSADEYSWPAPGCLRSTAIAFAQTPHNRKRIAQRVLLLAIPK